MPTVFAIRMDIVSCNRVYIASSFDLGVAKQNTTATNWMWWMIIERVGTDGKLWHGLFDAVTLHVVMVLYDDDAGRVPGHRISATRREISCHETFNRATTTTTTSLWWRWQRRWVMLIQGRCDGAALSGLPSTGPAATRAARRWGRPTELPASVKSRSTVITDRHY